ncbi:MAG: MlaD family protein [Sciscionella sp.]
MITRTTIVKLIAFAVIGVLGMAYTFWQYGGGKNVFPGSTYLVKMEMANGGGIFKHAEVAYRGVKVGEVSDMRLTNNGVEVDLSIDSSAPKIPANTIAAVTDLSAVGEQYVDLRPKSANGPTLDQLPADKRVIKQQDTKTPPKVQELVNNLDSLSNSVPKQSLRTVVDQLDTAFSGTGADLQQLLDTASSFTTAAQQNLPQTIQLLDSSRTVLDTQNAEASALKDFSSNLRKVAAQLKTSDGDIRKLITVTPAAAQQVNTVLRESGQGLSIVLANLLTTSKVLQPRTDALEMAMIVYPLVNPAVQTLVTNGQAHLGLALNFFNPPPCVRGYQGTQMRPGAGTYKAKDGSTKSATAPVKPNYQAYCAEPTGSPIDVRGAENAPYAGVPASPSQPGGSVSTQTQPTQSGSTQQSPFNLASLGPASFGQMAQMFGLNL